MVRRSQQPNKQATQKYKTADKIEEKKRQTRSQTTKFGLTLQNSFENPGKAKRAHSNRSKLSDSKNNSIVTSKTTRSKEKLLLGISAEDSIIFNEI